MLTSNFKAFFISYIYSLKIKFLHSTFTTVLSVLVLFSTLSLSVEKHFCGDKLVDAAFFTAKKCKGHDDNSNESNDTEHNCCKDEVEFIESQSDIIIKVFDDFEPLHHKTVDAYLYVNTDFSHIVSNQAIPNQFCHSSRFVRDIQLLDEVFLI
jgi:hypothetical protein